MRSGRALASLAGLWLAAGAVLQAAGQPVRVNEDARILAAFIDRVTAYVELHRKLDAKLGPLEQTHAAERIVAHQQELRHAIQTARGRADHGDILNAETRALFRRLIAGVLGGPDGANVRAALMDEEPVHVRIRVNRPYPASAPLSLVPPALLEALPRLPEELEYRFVRGDLILRDIEANLIVDYITRALS